MKTLLSLTIFLLALAALAPAQTTDYQPSYFAGVGLGGSRATDPLVTGGIVFGVRAPNTAGTWGTLEFANVTGITSTMQVGLLQQLAKRGNTSLLALGQAGGATDGQGGLTAMFGGGGVLQYALRGLSARLDGLSIAAVMKVVKINGTDVQLAFSGWLTKSF